MNAICYFFSLRMNQIFVFILMVLLPTSVIGTLTGEATLAENWPFPLLLALLLYEYTLASITQNESLRLVPGLSRKIIVISSIPLVAMFLVALAVGIGASGAIVLMLVYWTAITRLKHYISVSHHKTLDFLRVASFLLIYIDIDFQLNLALGTLAIVLLVGFQVFLIARPLPWNYSSPFKEQGRIDSQNKGTRSFSLFASSKHENAHSLNLYQPMFTTILFVALFIGIALVDMLLNKSAMEAKHAIFLCLSVYLSYCFAGVTFGDLRERCGWYQLRPGAGSMMFLWRKLGLQALKRTAMAIGVIFIVNLSVLLWQCTLNLASFKSLVYLHVSVIFLSLGLMFWFSSTKVSGFLALSKVTFVGLGIGLILTLLCLSFSDNYTYSISGLMVSLVLAAGFSARAVVNYRKINWV